MSLSPRDVTSTGTSYGYFIYCCVWIVVTFPREIWRTLQAKEVQKWVCLLCKMTDVWILIHLAFIQILFNRKRCTMSLWCFLLPLLVPTLAAPNRTAVINVYKAEKPTSRPQLSSTIKNDPAIAENVRGKYSELGNVKETNGRLHMVTAWN